MFGLTVFTVAFFPKNKRGVQILIKVQKLEPAIKTETLWTESLELQPAVEHLRKQLEKLNTPAETQVIHL